MIYKLVGLNQDDLYKKIGNMLNKVAESMDVREKENVELVSNYQPDDSHQDRRLLNDAFKYAVKKAVRAMAPYVNNEVGDVTIDPRYLTLRPEQGSSGLISVTANGSWTLSVSDTADNTGFTFAIPLAFPDTWLDVDVLQENIEDYVTTLMIVRYLENVDKRQAAWYTKEAEDKEHDIRTMCAARKPGTRFGVTNPFGESLWKYSTK